MVLAEKHNMTEEVAKRIFKILVDTGLYSFNKSHAIAYAILCYITGYLKTYYTREFLAACLTNAYERKEEVDDLIADCRRLGISFLEVDINKSNWDFTLENANDLRIGFCAVKSFGYKSYEQIEMHRPFASIEELVEKVVRKDCGKRALIPAIFTGAFNSLHNSPLETYKLYSEIIKEKELVETISVQGSKEKLSIYSSAMEFEEMFFGAMLTSDPINDFESIGIDNIAPGKLFSIIGIYDKIKKHKTKAKQEQMAFITIKTGDGLLECTVFPNQYDKYKKLIKKNLVCKFTMKKDYRDPNNLIVDNIEMA
jgi:DNA polymerase-3 subunit alpha